jgi:hypothetical protein
MRDEGKGTRHKARGMRGKAKRHELANLRLVNLPKAGHKARGMRGKAKRHELACRRQGTSGEVERD